MPRLISVFDWQARAHRRLSVIARDYLEEGAEDEASLRRNREAFGRIAFDPRVLTGNASVDLSTRVLDADCRFPVAIGPTGNASLFWADGDLALARAAAAAGVPFVLSTNASAGIEEVAAVPVGARWFQLYALREDAATDRLVRRAADSGYTVLALTVDSAASGKRERSIRHGARMPMRLTLPLAIDAQRHPSWGWQMLRHGAPRWKNIDAPGVTPGSKGQFSFDATFKRALGWEDVARIRAIWPGRLVLKGVQSLTDAVAAREHGLDGIVLSNHGGRQLDGSPSPMDLLPEVARAIGEGMTVMIDGGFRRGSDIVKALALGARCVWLGRATLYGLAAAGEAGVADVLGILREETERAMCLLGAPSVAALGYHHLRLPPGMPG